MNYYRFTKKEKLMSDWGHAMFAIDRETVVGYGNTEWQYNGENAVNINNLKKDIIEAWQEDQADGFENFYEADLSFYIESDPEEIFEGFNPSDIVDSAENWDSELLVWFWERVAAPNDIDAVLTQDGAIVFEESLIVKI